MDIVGSVIAMTILFPAFVAIAVAIKLTSSGPALFRQERIGRHGKPFEFFKFRSMYLNGDATIHRQYVTQFISGRNSTHKGIYKLTNDPRITPLGKVLRKASLDELPQFWNVLKGDMSLVGPRPSLAYEIQSYDVWHRRRVFEAKPGITGLWQIKGRSKVEFDEMVRLDLRYIESSSFWLDLKILAQTPRAVLVGDGAY